MERPLFLPISLMRLASTNSTDKSGTPEKSTILEAPGSGVALLDYDNDGWLDIYLLNGSTVPALKGKETPPRDVAA
jgi:hypothetical protein